MTKYQFTVMQYLPEEEYGLHDLNRMGGMGWNMTGILKYPNGIVEIYFSRPMKENEIDS